MSTLRAKTNRMYGWHDPSPDFYLIKHVWDILQQMCARPDAGCPHTRAHLGVVKNLSSCNQETDSQLEFYVYGYYLR